MNFRISVPLENDEGEALCNLAVIEKRSPRNQAAFIIRRELERIGLLPVQIIETKPEESQQTNGGQS